MWELVKTVGEEFQVTASWLRGCQDCKTKVANMRNRKHILISLHFFSYYMQSDLLIRALITCNIFPLLSSAENSNYSYSEGSPIDQNGNLR